MDERERAPEGAPEGEQELARLLADAGPRPAVPPEDLAAIQAVARAAWKAKVASSSPALRPAEEPGLAGPVGVAAPVRPGPARPVRLPIRRWRAAALAASLALAAALLWWWMRAAQPPTAARVEAARGGLEVDAGDGWRAATAGETLRAGTRLRASRGGDAALRLAGGAAVRLATGSRATLEAADALALAAGSVHVDTDGAPGAESSSAAAALVVITPVGEARDVGTRFSVRLLGTGAEAMRVQVRSGAVSVEQRERSWRAGASQELTLHRDGRVERRTLPPGAAGWDWPPGGAAFALEGSTVSELLDWVAAETGWRVRHADPDVGAIAARTVLHGELGTLDAAEAPFVLLPGAGLEAELAGDVLTVRRRLR